MPDRLHAACLCHIGRVRKNNEDNFCFGTCCLEAENLGLSRPLTMSQPLRRRPRLAVFDGMGGEENGEWASFTAAYRMCRTRRGIKERFAPESAFLRGLGLQLNAAVVARQRELGSRRMGSTMAAVSFSRSAYCLCSLGDSRIYLLRDGALRRLSMDHVEEFSGRRKAPLTQFLGIDPEIYAIEPFVAEGALKSGDRFLLCSDGLTDMVPEPEIAGILGGEAACGRSAERLVAAALEHGGRDNVTVIVCLVE